MLLSQPYAANIRLGTLMQLAGIPSLTCSCQRRLNSPPIHVRDVDADLRRHADAEARCDPLSYRLALGGRSTVEIPPQLGQ